MWMLLLFVFRALLKSLFAACTSYLEAAQHQEVAASGFAAVGGYGECQLYILSVGGRNVGARCVNRFREAAQIG